MNKKGLEVFSDKFQAMGTEISLDIIFEGKIENAIFNEIRNIFSRNEEIFSRFKKTSELSKINSQIGKKITISSKMFEILNLCLKFNEKTDGYFDPRIITNLEIAGYNKDFKSNNLNSNEEKDLVFGKINKNLKEDIILRNEEKRTIILNERIDTSGVVKSYTVKEAAGHLKNRSFENFLINAGGDIYASGHNKSEEKWKIIIEGAPEERNSFEISNEAVATSGISRRKWKIGGRKMHHIVNPKSPEKFSSDLKTVTVVGDDIVEADIWAKTLFLMGIEKGLGYSNKRNIKSLFLDYKGNLYVSEKAKKII